MRDRIHAPAPQWRGFIGIHEDQGIGGWVNTAGKPGTASLPIATWTTHGLVKNNAA